MAPLKEALTALADEILFEWLRTGRLVGELSVLMKRRHPEVQAEIDRVYQEHLAKLGKKKAQPAVFKSVTGTSRARASWGLTKVLTYAPRAVKQISA